MNIQKIREIQKDKTYGMHFNKDAFITPDVQSINYKGYNIDIIFDAAYEEDDQGHICHKIVLSCNNLCAGYLRVYYLPEENKKEYFPNIAYLLETKGCSFNLSKVKRRVDSFPDVYSTWEEKSDDDKKKILERMYITLNYGLYREFYERTKNEIIDLDKEYNIVIKKMEKDKSIQEKVSDSKKVLDKPTIDFSDIRGKKGDNFKYGNISASEAIQSYLDKKGITLEQFQKEDRSLDLQGIGLGKLMYKYMADWMALNKLPLRKGGTNEYSTPLWEESFKNDDRFTLVKTNDGLILDHTNHDLSYLRSKNKRKNKCKF